MDILKQLHQDLTSNTIEELELNGVKQIQELLIKYFTETELKKTDNNKVVYEHNEPFVKELEDMLRAGSLPIFYVYDKLLSKTHPKNVLIHGEDFIDSLVKLLIGDIELDLKISAEITADKYDYYYHNLIFEFNLKDNVKYKTGVHAIVDYLMEKREIEMIKNTKEQCGKRQMTNDFFQYLCDDVKQSYAERKGYVGYFDKSIYHVYAYLSILDGFKKHQTIKYRYSYIYNDFNQPSECDFTEKEQNILNSIFGFHDQELVFEYRAREIWIILSKEHKLSIPDEVMKECLDTVERCRIANRKELLEFVKENKSDIIDSCCHTLKCNKFIGSEKDSFCIDHDFYLTNPISHDYNLITPEISNEINKILGLEGFITITTETNEMDMGDGVYGMCEDSYTHKIYMIIPPAFKITN